jgi:hypothetical protein
MPPAGELELRNDGFLRIYRDRVNGVLVWWYGAPPGADPHDPDTWRRANPASWLQDGATLAKEYGRLKGRGALVEWRTFHLSQFVESAEPWMPAEEWEAAAGDPVFRLDVPTFAAIRIAHDHRAAVVALAQRQGDRLALRCRTFEAEEGEHVDLDAVEAYCRRLHARYRAPVLTLVRYSARGKETMRNRPGPEFAHHGAFMSGSAQRLAKDGLVVVDVPSTPERITPAAESLMAAVTEGRLEHDGDAVLGREMSNVRARPAPKGWTIEAAADARVGSSGRIIAAQAAMLAVHRAMTAPSATVRRMRGGNRA